MYHNPFNWFNCTGTILAANQPAKGTKGGGGGKASQVVCTRERLLANLFRQMWHAVTVPNLVGVATAGLNGFSRTRDATNGQQQQQQRQQQQRVGGWGGAVGGRRAGQGGPAESVRLLRIPKEKVHVNRFIYDVNRFIWQCGRHGAYLLSYQSVDYIKLFFQHL